ncbi:MAG: hypothetical protein JWQ78_1495, partial [Sediminibacterium sp.]|nr:hypothetical protein [Sediminibacterium sp.]
MKYWYLLVVFALGWPDVRGQLSRDAISTDFVLYQRRIDFERNMRERTINAVFAQPLDSNSEDRYREACWAISQFLLRSAQIEKGFRNIFTKYASLEDATKSAWLEAVYGSYPAEYTKEMKQLLPKETNARLFARQAVYLFRIDHSPANANYLRRSLRRQFEGFQNDVVLAELDNYLQHHYSDVAGKTPSITALFKQQQQSGQKMIYSFQRW